MCQNYLSQPERTFGPLPRRTARQTASRQVRLREDTMATDYVPDLFMKMMQGDRVALNDWLAEKRQLLKTMAVKAGLSPGHGGDLSDVVQDAELTVFRELLKGEEARKFANEVELLSWLQSVLRNRAVDHVRKNPKHILEVNMFEQPGTINSLGSLLDSRVAKDTRRMCIEEATLEDIQKEIILKHEVEGLSLKVIAEVLEKDPVYVAKEYYKGMGTAVRQKLDDLAEHHWQEMGEPRKQQLIRALQSLTVQQRKAVELKHFEAPTFSMNEVAVIIGCTPQAVGGLVYRGIESLKLLLIPPPPAQPH